MTLCALLAMAGAVPADAQGSSVDIDLGALDSLGPPPQSASPNRIRLRPPQAAAPKRPVAALPPAQPAQAPPQPQTAAPVPPRAAVAPPAATPTRAAPPLQQAKTPPPAVLPPPPTGAEATPPPQIAARNPTVAAVGTVEQRIVFAADAIVLPDAAKADLERLAKRLTGEPRLYLQIVAYAGNEADASQARRTSLSRALAARSYLVDQGVAIKQIDVRPLGSKPEAGLPPDRVDLVVAER